MKRQSFIIGILLILISMSHISITESSLLIKVTGLRNDKGKVGIKVFKKTDKFPETEENVVKNFFITSSDKVAQTTITLPAGDYAIAVMHDEDGDKEFDKSFIGIPQEGFGFSKNPEIKYRAPKFSECSFTVGAVKTDLNIKMIYY